MNEPEEAQQDLIIGLRQGDPEAQIQLLSLYGEPLVRFLIYVCQVDAVEAEDLAVEALYRAIERIDSFGERPTSGLRSFRNWLFTIARNLWRDRMRRERQICNVPIEDLEFLTPRWPSVETDAVSPAVQVVQEALTELPDSQRLTLMLHYSGLQLKEVAQLLGVQQGTVRQWKRRGLAALAKMLTGHPALSHLVGQEANVRGETK